MARLTLFFFLLFTLSPSASAAKLSLLGLAQASRPRAATEPSGDFAAQTAWGGGALLELGLVPSVGLEFGALYAPRAYTSTLLGTTTHQPMIQFPLVAKAYLAQLLSIGVGGYVSTLPDEAPTAAAEKHTDYGFVTSLGLYFPLSSLTHIMLDGRYTMGLDAANAGPDTGLRYSDVQVLAGFQFLI
jgi:hypothetical protein